MDTTRTYPWEPSEDLETPESIVHYLEAALEDGDSKVIAAVLGDIARSKGMTAISEATGLGRESLYKSLSENGNPEFATVLKVVEALGLRLLAVPIDSDRAA